MMDTRGFRLYLLSFPYISKVAVLFNPLSPPHAPPPLGLPCVNLPWSAFKFGLPVARGFIFRGYSYGHGVSVCVLWSSWRSRLQGTLATCLTALFS